MKIVAISIASAAAVFAVSVDAHPIKRPAPKEVRKVNFEAAAAAMEKAEFAAAVKKHDVAAMRRQLSRFGVAVEAGNPQFIPECKPPVGMPMWGWIPYSLPATGKYWGVICVPMWNSLLDDQLGEEN